MFCVHTHGLFLQISKIVIYLLWPSSPLLCFLPRYNHQHNNFCALLCSSGRNFNVFVEASLQGLKFYNDLLRNPGKQSFANEWCTLHIVVEITKHAISNCNYLN